MKSGDVMQHKTHTYNVFERSVLGSGFASIVGADWHDFDAVKAYFTADMFGVQSMIK